MVVNELMIGDYVYDEANKLYTKVIAITPIRVIIDPYTEGDEQGLIGSDLKGIPLTEEILKANGFVNGWRQLELEYIDKGNGWFLVDIEAESIEDGVVTKLCRYVHEVQHALRICKRNGLADNFKLK